MISNRFRIFRGAYTIYRHTVYTHDIIMHHLTITDSDFANSYNFEKEFERVFINNNNNNNMLALIYCFRPINNQDACIFTCFD